MRVKRKPKSSPSLSPLAIRLKEERLRHRFSQEELAALIGVKRAAFGEYEIGRSNMPLGIGLRVCRQLDLNPRWLATGVKPKIPFVPLAELGINEVTLLTSVVTRRLDFLRGYELHLKDAVDRWVEKTPVETILKRVSEELRESALRKASELELCLRIEELLELATTRDDIWKARVLLDDAEVVLKELRSRLEAKLYQMPPK